MDEPTRSKSGIRETRGSLSKQIERTQEIKFPTGEDAVKYWFRPPAPPPVDLSKPPEADDESDAVKGNAGDESDAVKENAGDESDAVKENSVDAPRKSDKRVKKQVARPAIVSETRPHRTQATPVVPDQFFAYRVSEDGEGGTSRKVVDVRVDELPAGETDVLIRVDYSSLNYKDAMAASGHKGVAGKFPLTPGIDAAGVVAESNSPVFSPGDEVLVTGFDLGTYFDGGFGQYIRVPSEWIVRCPPGIDLKTAMTYGTAGLTAALSINELERNGVGPRSGEILVTGATGGVGSIAVGILAQAGYDVVAVTGKLSEHDYLKSLGATEIIDRDEFLKADDKRPMQTSRWSGVVDCVGGQMLELALKQANYGAAVTCCGMVAGGSLATSVYPFIIRGIRLIGVDSAMALIPLRNRIWRRIANEWKLSCLDQVTTEITLAELDAAIDTMLAGDSQGRIVLRH